MATLVISENVTLDGVVEDPTGERGFAHGGWFEEYMGADRGAWAGLEFAEAQAASALLLGRTSDAYFGERWNDASGEWPDRLNGLPKYVVSSTITEPVWRNSTVLPGDVVEEVTRLKTQVPGEIVVYASRRLVQTLMEHGLVDEVRLVVFPVVLGSGERLFGGAHGKMPLRLLASRGVGEGLVHLTYEVLPAAGADPARGTAR
nr:dihydrofolate reductase family protein [Microbacterium bovistercoris]